MREWEFVVPYLLLSREDSGHREHDLREVFNAVRYVAKTGCPWRWVPGDLPPWAAVYQQMRRWLAAGCFEALVSGSDYPILCCAPEADTLINVLTAICNAT
jgi:transposase